jgi:hypothetical protein
MIGHQRPDFRLSCDPIAQEQNASAKIASQSGSVNRPRRAADLKQQDGDRSARTDDLLRGRSNQPGSDRNVENAMPGLQAGSQQTVAGLPSARPERKNLVDRVAIRRCILKKPANSGSIRVAAASPQPRSRRIAAFLSAITVSDMAHTTPCCLSPRPSRRAATHVGSYNIRRPDASGWGHSRVLILRSSQMQHESRGYN